MSAGSYEIRNVSATGSIYQLVNRESGQSTLVSMSRPLRQEFGKAPRVVFTCQEASCQLKELWPQSGVGVAAKPRK